MNPASIVTDRLPLPGRKPAALRRVLELDLAHGVVSAPPTSPVEAWRHRHSPTVRAIRDGLHRAAHDDQVVGLLVHVGDCPLSLAEADEIGALIAHFSESKPSVAWTETFGELGNGLAGYRVALNARDIWVQPSGGLGLVGVHVSITLLRGALAKLGLEPEFAKRHEYKSAADQFAATEVSDANREMMQRIADSIVDDTVRRVAASRALDETAVRATIDAAPLTATAALEAGLVTAIGYRDEVYDWARAEWASGSGRGGQDWELIYAHRYAKESVGSQLKTLTGRHRSEIAVIDVRGPIVTGAGGNPSQAAADPICSRLREVGRNDKVKAVVLRIDSPGGSYVASDTIRREVLRLREGGRPVVAQMGNVAASGGYFVAMGADEIIAQPTTLTGSIGVLAGKFVTEQLIEKVGLVHEGIDVGAHAGMMGPARGFTEDEWAVLNDWLDQVYADFTSKAAADRGLELEVLEPLARGRVWTGADAAERALVDHLGGSALSLGRACALADLDPDDIHITSPPPWNLLRELRPAQSSDAETSVSLSLVEPLGTALSGQSVEALLRRVATASGLPAPTGVLSLPWAIRLS